MVADTVKSASITNLDGTTVLMNTAGEGGPALTRMLSDYAAATAAGLADTTSTYRILRLPSNVVMQDLTVFTKAGLDSSTGLAIDVGAYYSDSPNEDGTAPSNSGAAISTNCFLSNTAFGQSSAGSNLNALANLDANLRTSQLWKQVGLTSDPGGFIDVVVAVHTAKTGTASAGNIGLRALYAQ